MNLGYPCMVTEDDLADLYAEAFPDDPVPAFDFTLGDGETATVPAIPSALLTAV